MTRTLTGTVVRPDGSPITSGFLRVVARGVLAVDADSGAVLTRAYHDFPIVSGEISGSIVGGALYEFTVYENDRRVIEPFTTAVQAAEGDISFDELYLSRFTPPDLPAPVLRGGDDITRLSTSETSGNLLLTPDGSGGLAWSVPDWIMSAADYDADQDGKVDAAAYADAAGSASSATTADSADVAVSAPWTGITGIPATFPPSTHVHAIDAVTGLQSALDGLTDSTATNAADIQAEAEARAQADADEVAAREAAVADLQAQLNAESDAAWTFTNTVYGQLQDEMNTRAVNDATLTAAIGTEAGNRASGDTAVLNALSTHTGTAAPHVGHLVKAPADDTRNVVQATTAGYVPFRLLRHASSADNDVILAVQNAAGTATAFAVNAGGRIGAGTAPDSGAEWSLTVASGIRMNSGARLRDVGFGADIYLSRFSTAGVYLLPCLQVGSGSAAPAGTIEAISQTTSKPVVYARAANGQTGAFFTCRSSDGATTYFEVSPSGVVSHAGGVVSIGGNARGANATDLQTFRSNASYVASGSGSAIGGGRSNTSSGFCSTVPGGETCFASAASSFATGRSAQAIHSYAAAFGDGSSTRWPGGVTYGIGRTISNYGETQGHVIALGARSTSSAVINVAAFAVSPSQVLVFKGTAIAAEVNGGANFATWDVRVTVRRDGSGNATVSAVIIDEIDGGPGYALSTAVDTTAQTLKFNFAGLDGHDVLVTLNFLVTEVKR